VRVQTLECDAERARQVIAELKMQEPEEWNHRAGNDEDS